MLLPPGQEGSAQAGNLGAQSRTVERESQRPGNGVLSSARESAAGNLITGIRGGSPQSAAAMIEATWSTNCSARCDQWARACCPLGLGRSQGTPEGLAVHQARRLHLVQPEALPQIREAQTHKAFGVQQGGSQGRAGHGQATRGQRKAQPCGSRLP